MRLLEKISNKAFSNSKETTEVFDIYDVEIRKLDGTPLRLKDFKGKYLLFVNVASKCGFTGQYKDLEKLFQNHSDRLMVVGLPCNQFGAQEPGNAEQIGEFCQKNYGVSFIMTEKIDVKGDKKHPLYQWLTDKRFNGKKSSSVKWNFQKYLVSPKGSLVDFYYSTTSPLSAKITKHLRQ